MHNPVHTYRIQFHKDFSFKELEQIIPYLQQLGISTLYASPIFEATPGSTHGYDVTNPHRINPELGTEKQLKSISKLLQAQDINWLQDIVPNHMAYVPQNGWLMDVLEKGQLSAYAPFFDVAWTSQLYHGRIMVPFLGSPLEDVLEKGELSIDYQQQRLVIKYYSNAFPLHPRSYASLLKAEQENMPQAVQQLLGQLPQIQRLEEPKALSERWDEFLQQMAGLMKDKETKAWIKARLKTASKDKQLIQQIVEDQAYRLCYWQETEKQINFRRFFTVNSLICLNVQDEQVFEHYHQYIHSLLKQGIFHGLRIDHIDGLYDPAGYLERLRELVGDNTFLTIEKILEPGEKLPTDWPVQGTTGYGFLAMVNNLFTNAKSEKSFTKHYQKLTGNTKPVHDQILEKKEFILYQRMAGELDNLHQLFLELNLADKKTLKELPEGSLKEAIGEFLIHCPVYRYYGNQFPLDDVEAAAVADILQHIRKAKKSLIPAVDLLEKVLLKQPQQGKKEFNERALRFYQRCMQFTGPLMAKGVEDTLMYTYNRFVGHNEVGDSPEVFEVSATEFHQRMLERQQHWPLSINTTSTHDTKRGEDVRARLHVLTDLPEEWLQQVEEWQKINWGLKQNGMPDANDEYLIYQNLIGSYPMPGQDDDNIKERLQEYLQKALREAKQHSNWSTPNEQYEEATKEFAVRLLDKDRAFWSSFQQFHQRVADFGIINSLSQVLLKFTCPGLPDVYQGTELWDLSLVDPDNRRPVNYNQRLQWLNELINTKATPDTLLHQLWDSRYNGKIKLWLTHKLFKQRKQQATLFEKGQYIPLRVQGAYKDHIIAFIRRYQQEWTLIAVPLHLASLSKQQQKDPLRLDWKDTRLVLPAEAPTEWQHLLQGAKGKAGQHTIAVQDIFTHLPLAVLNLQPDMKDRNAGILMHISSLPSAFGVGDFGPEARHFADFLSRSRQTYWQLLPLNPTELGTGHSPYSSYSSMAGNTLLLSPEMLAEEGLLNKEAMHSYHLPKTEHAAYEQAEKNKNELFEQAWQNYQSGNFSSLQRQFEQFNEQEAQWLNDFALYLVLKQEHGGQAWFQWPEKFKQRQEQALEQFGKQHEAAIQKVKWLQFLFSKQWHALREYCNSRGVKFFGDLPFYVSYDSVDVWSNPEIFSLDKDGNMLGVAGVPPDYFNENGQNWGMPVFKWEVLKEQKYSWWVRRIRKNMELYDVLRLDHFRAFADYWEVPAGEETAKNGQWKQGPGILLFKTLSKELGKLPFIAEDLGDINDAVYELRDKLALPGMKVLQFAFGDEMPRSIYIPHNYTPNYIVYTGTHDNNTTRGWYRQNLSKEDRSRMETYVGNMVLEKEVHLAMGRLAYASVAKTAILPLQDILGLDESARMNMPASTENNWLWRLQPDQLTVKHEEQLREWCQVYHRG